MPTRAHEGLEMAPAIRFKRERAPPGRVVSQAIIARLDGLPEATGKARSILRELIDPVKIRTEGDEVWASSRCGPVCCYEPQIGMVGVRRVLVYR